MAIHAVASALVEPLGACLYTAEEVGCRTSTWFGAPPPPDRTILSPCAPKSTRAAAASCNGAKPVQLPSTTERTAPDGWPQTTAREGIEVCCHRKRANVARHPCPAPPAGPSAASLCEELKTRPVQSTGPSDRSGGRSMSGRRPESPSIAHWPASGSSGSGAWARATFRHRVLP